MDRKRLIFICRIIFPILTIAWMGLIFFFSSQTGKESGELSGTIVDTTVDIIYGESFETFPEEKQVSIYSIWSMITRKGAHFSIFGVLGVLAFLTAFSYWHSDWSYLIAVGFTALYAVSDEFHQGFVGGRAGMATDVLIDTSGSIVFLLAIYIIVKLIKRHRLKKCAN